MKFNKKLVTEIISQPKSGKKVFTEGKKQNVILSEEQLDRLLSQLNESREKSINGIIKDAYELIRESIKSENLDLSIDDYSPVLTEDQSEWSGGRNPGVAAAEGLENVLDGIKKAYEMIKDSDTRKKLANSITKLGNFMTITADAIASGRDQRAPRSGDSLRDPLPYPELDEGEDKEVEEVHHEMDEEAKPDFLDLDGDGDKKESMKKASKESKKKKSIKEHNEKLIQEEIKKMKQIIQPITKSVLREDREWMKGVNKDIERRGTEGVFHKWCVDHGYENGCSKGCWDKAEKAGDPWRERAALAKTFCDDNPYN